MKNLWRGLALAASLWATVPAFAAEDMSFRVVRIGDTARCGAKCPQVIVAEGQITPRTPDAFVDFVRRNRTQPELRSIVYFHSPGGSVVASMRLGLMLRKLGAAAVVARPLEGMPEGSQFSAAGCFSACVYALMGGKKRVIPPQSQVGIHRMFSYELGADPTGNTASVGRQRRFDDGHVVAALSRYTGQMGISRDLVAFAERTSPDSIHILSQAEISRWRLGSPKL